MTGITLQFILNHHYRKGFARYATKTKTFDICVKTACVIIATSSVFRITRKPSHVLVALGLGMKKIMAGKIRQVWTLWKRHNLWKIRKAFTTSGWRKPIPNKQFNIAERSLKAGGQIVTLNCCSTFQIQTCLILAKLKMFANMLLHTLVNVTTQAIRRRPQFKTWSLGK